GERLPGVTVTWSVADGAGQPQPPVSVTDSQGQATTAWRLGTAPGLQVLRAEAPPAPPVTFQASATASSADRASLTPRAVTLDALGETARFSVEAFDRYDNPLSAVPVAWSVSNSAVARVDDVGLVTALANG